jgi:predicted ATPase
MRISSEHGFSSVYVAAVALQAFARGAQVPEEEDVAQARQFVDGLRAVGSDLGRTVLLTLLAELHGRIGQSRTGLLLLAEALDLAEKTDERIYEAEIYRSKGELLLLRSEDDQAEACFQQAREVARRQGAKWWELRTSVSLARLWQKQGKKDEARKLLTPIYGWFTEGFDTADLKDAKALLDELG